MIIVWSCIASALIANCITFSALLRDLNITKHITVIPSPSKQTNIKIIKNIHQGQQTVTQKLTTLISLIFPPLLLLRSPYCLRRKLIPITNTPWRKGSIINIQTISHKILRLKVSYYLLTWPKEAKFWPLAVK